MKMSRYLVPTLKEDPSDAVITSHRLMLRAGLIRKESAGIHLFAIGFARITEDHRHYQGRDEINQAL